MPNIGIPELLLVLVIVLIIFGPKKLPEIGRAVGKSIRGFKDETDTMKQEMHKAAALEAPPAKDRDKTP